MISLADLQRAEQCMELAEQTTDTGVHISARRTMPPAGTTWKNRMQIAWKSYQPQAAESAVAILFIAGDGLSGAIYHATALALAEHGLPTHAMSLAGQGSGHWASFEPQPRAQMTLGIFQSHVSAVCQVLLRDTGKLILAGDGLGGILAQRYALERPKDLAGLILLGSCSPHRAAAVWPPTPWWHVRARTRLSRPPSVDAVRATLLDQGTNSQEVFALWQTVLQPEAPRLRQEYRGLARQQFWAPHVPTLLLAGGKDHVIKPFVREGSAADYGIKPLIIPGAPHLVAWGSFASITAEHIRHFCLTQCSDK